MKKLILFLIVGVNLFFVQTSWATEPNKGSFEWKIFFGFYKYVECKIDQNKPIWADDPENTEIEISNLSEINPDKMDITRWPKDASYILLGVSLEYINQGRKIEFDEDTQKISREIETYSTEDGIYSYLSWNFKDINVGWSTVQLKMLQNGNIKYIMQIQRVEDVVPSREECELSVLPAKNLP